MAASATGLGAAPNAAIDNTTPAAIVVLTRILFRCSLDQASQVTGAVADGFLMNAVHPKNTQQHVPGCNRLGGECQVPPALELAGGSAQQDVRHVVVQVLVGIAHV